MRGMLSQGRAATAVITATILFAAACSPRSSTDLPHGVTAVAGSDTLMEADLEEMLVRSPVVPDLDMAQSLISSWIDLALFNSATRADPDLSGVRESSLEATIKDQAVLSYAERVGAEARAPTEAEADSVIRLNLVRTFDVYGIPVSRMADSAEFISAAGDLETFRGSVAQFDSPAQAFDQLPAATRNRFELVRLGAVGRGDLQEALAEELWKLRPGEMTPVMAGPTGVQVFVRRNSAEFKSLVIDWLRPQIRALSDASKVDSIAAANNLRLTDDAIARVRAAMQEPFEVEGDGPLATWNGGELTPAALFSRISGLQPNERAGLVSESDTIIASLTDRFARAELLASIASAQLTPEERTAQREFAESRWSDAIDTLRAGLAAAGGGTPTELLRAIVEGRMPARALPAGLAGVLRAQSNVVVDRESARRAAAAALRRWGGTGTAT